VTEIHPAVKTAATGLIAGCTLAALMHLFSGGIFRLPFYSHTLFAMSIIHMYASLLLVLFFTGCTVPFLLRTSSRRTILLHAAFAGLIATSLVRVLLVSGNPARLISSLISTLPQLFILLAIGMVITAIGGLVASCIQNDTTPGFAPLIPVAAVIIAVIVLPPLLTTVGISTGIIQHTPTGTEFCVTAYNTAVSGTPTDIRILKLSTDGAMEWEQTVDISTFDGADVLTELPDGYALASVQEGQEYHTVHLIWLEPDGTVSRLPGIRTPCSQVSSLIPAQNGGYLVATDAPELIRITATGAPLWKKSLPNITHAPVSLLARDDGTVIAAWANQTACLEADGTILWVVSPEAFGSGPSPVLLSGAEDAGILVCTEGRTLKGDNHHTVYPVAVRLDAEGTVLWEQSFGNGVGDTILGVWQDGRGHTILYRTNTFPKDIRGGVVQAYASHIVSLNENGTITGSEKVEDSGGDVVASLSGGYLSLDIGENTITGTAYDAKGEALRTQEYDVQANPSSLRGIGTADSGYLIAVSSPFSHEE